MSRNHVRMLNTPRWRHVRRLVFQRDGWRCKLCGLRGKLECDHVVPLHLGGDPWDQENLQTACRTCHIAKTRAENLARQPPEKRAWRRLVEELL